MVKEELAMIPEKSLALAPLIGFSWPWRHAVALCDGRTRKILYHQGNRLNDYSQVDAAMRNIVSVFEEETAALVAELARGRKYKA